MSKKGPRILWISLAVLVVLLIGTYVGISSWVHRFLRSEDFRRLVSEKTGQTLRSDASYGPLRWQGDSLFTDTFQATGEPGSIIESLRAEQVRAEVNWRAMQDGAWRVEQVDVLSFEGVFRPGTPEPPKTGPTTNRPSGLASFLPKRFELGQLNINQAQIVFRGEDHRDLVTVENSALRVKPDGVGWTIDGNGGTLTLPKLPLLQINNFRSRIQAPVFFLTEANLRLGDTGKIKAAGEFATASKLDVEWTGVDAGAFLDSSWKSRLSGALAGNAHMEWPEAGVTAGTMKGSFLLTEGLLQNLTVLDKIATFASAPQFRRMPLQQLSGDYQWSKGDLTITKLILESKGLLRVEGDYRLSATGAVDGNLRVGVTPQTLQWLPGSREKVFTEARGGYLWTNARISGSLDNLQEDLSTRLAHAMKDEVIEQGTKVLDVLPGPTKEGAKGLLDILTPLIPVP